MCSANPFRKPTLASKRSLWEELSAKNTPRQTMLEVYNASQNNLAAINPDAVPLT